MRRFSERFSVLLFLSIISGLLDPSLASDKLVLHFFGSPTCAECLDIKHTILFPARDAHPEKIDLRINDVDSDSGFKLLMDTEKLYGVKTTAVGAIVTGFLVTLLEAVCTGQVYLPTIIFMTKQQYSRGTTVDIIC